MDALRIGSVNDLRLLRSFTPSSQNSGLIITAKFSAPPGHHPRPVPLGLAPHRPAFPGVMAAATTVTGYDPTSLQDATMETKDQAMPSEHEYLADMVKLWQRKQSQAAASPKGQGSRAATLPEVAASGSSTRCSPDGTRTTPPSPPRRQPKWRLPHTLSLCRDDYIVVLKPRAPFELKSVLASDRAGDAIRAYLGEHSSTSFHVWPVWDQNVLVCSVTTLPMAQRLLGDIQLPAPGKSAGVSSPSTQLKPLSASNKNSNGRKALSWWSANKATAPAAQPATGAPQSPLPIYHTLPLEDRITLLENVVLYQISTINVQYIVAEVVQAVQAWALIQFRTTSSRSRSVSASSSSAPRRRKVAGQGRAWTMTHKTLDIHHGNSFIYTFAIISIRNHPVELQGLREQAKALASSPLPSISGLSPGRSCPPRSRSQPYPFGLLYRWQQHQSAGPSQSIFSTCTVPRTFNGSLSRNSFIGLSKRRLGIVGFTLLTDPAHPTRLGNSVTRDTCPDLSLTRNIRHVTWENLEDTLDSDHFLLRIAFPTQKMRHIRGPACITGLPGMGIIRPPHTSIIHTMHLHLHLSPHSRYPPAPTLGAHHSLTRRWRRFKLNRKLRSRIQALTAEAAEYSAELADTNWEPSRSFHHPRGNTTPTSWRLLVNDLCDRYLCRTVDPKGPDSMIARAMAKHSALAIEDVYREALVINLLSLPITVATVRFQLYLEAST
ncbi:hypothetical protein HPB49_013331 [Dermacentor silvarum]|uniref:Uncharacterized protein n=1 Tax=Dermacentor silvarum TaxID=543639 RepID=A0ACB8CFF5_DERSI|nr:hypothetical protein HPB49_013331 [Dermacentor silvarum]